MAMTVENSFTQDNVLLLDPIKFIACNTYYTCDSFE